MCRYIRELIEDAYIELSFLLDGARLGGDAETALRVLAAMGLLERAAELLAACQPRHVAIVGAAEVSIDA